MDIPKLSSDKISPAARDVVAGFHRAVVDEVAAAVAGLAHRFVCDFKHIARRMNPQRAPVSLGLARKRTGPGFAASRGVTAGQMHGAAPGKSPALRGLCVSTPAADAIQRGAGVTSEALIV